MEGPRACPTPVKPAVVRVRDYRRETHDTFTLVLDPPATGGAAFRPGQFNMLYVFGVGEAPISLSGDPGEGGGWVHTIRAVGAVTRALARLRPGDVLGLRGPYGSSWPLENARGRDVVLVSGGIGLAPLRPVLYHLRRHRAEYGKIALLYGARSPADALYLDELRAWRAAGELQVLLTVDRGDPSWTESLGLVTALFDRADFAPDRAVGLICGPEIMMRFTQREFAKRGVADERLYVSLERNMHCAVGFCGHCQLGPSFVCMDGPVFRYDRIRTFFEIREA
ncbi:MAG: FAD/NAD(P)-binding protein [Gemmataceae bacterium]|nr:FAD/NAD(P)-binding protein [Gemmataceae bacterium]